MGPGPVRTGPHAIDQDYPLPGETHPGGSCILTGSLHVIRGMLCNVPYAPEQFIDLLWHVVEMGRCTTTCNLTSTGRADMDAAEIHDSLAHIVHRHIIDREVG